MDSEFKYCQSNVIKYLKDTLSEKLSKENEIDTANKKNRKIPFARRFIKLSRNNFEIQEKFSIIPAKSNFYLSTKHSEDEIGEIIDHATKVCKKAKYKKSVLKDCEDYFQMKLDVHAENKLILTNRDNLMAFGCLLILFLLVSNLWIPAKNPENILTVPAIVAGIILLQGLVKVFSDLVKSFVDAKDLNSTISYRYCILILKIAQSKINERDEKTKKLSDIS
jgi:hypothetical protein